MTLPGVLYLTVIQCLMLLQARNLKLLQQSLKKVRLGTIHLQHRHALGGGVSPFADICQRLPMLEGGGGQFAGILMVADCRGVWVKNRKNLPTS